MKRTQLTDTEYGRLRRLLDRLAGMAYNNPAQYKKELEAALASEKSPRVRARLEARLERTIARIALSRETNA